MSGRYAGSELEVFAGAVNWKRYVGTILRPFIGARVLEVGAGIGSNIRYLACDTVREWTSLEPDAMLANRIAARATAAKPPDWRVIAGTLDKIDAAARFETILYIDVLEHIADDRLELTRAAHHLVAGGALVVLAPAHQFLFSSFDAAIGHHRRYSVASLAALSPPSCRRVYTAMLDSAGFFASLANRLLLRSPLPSARQIAFWDKVLVPLSRVLDRVTGHRFGKTVVAVWQRA